MPESGFKLDQIMHLLMNFHKLELKYKLALMLSCSDSTTCVSTSGIDMWCTCRRLQSVCETSSLSYNRRINNTEYGLERLQGIIETEARGEDGANLTPQKMEKHWKENMEGFWYLEYQKWTLMVVLIKPNHISKH